MEAIPGIAYLVPICGQTLGCPGRDLLVQWVIAEGKQGEHACKAEGRNQYQDKGRSSLAQQVE
jgi:hypothetical protein